MQEITSKLKGTKKQVSHGKKLKKYKITVGICGPHILYTNIIKAYRKDEAVKKYMEESVEEFGEERYVHIY